MVRTKIDVFRGRKFQRDNVRATTHHGSTLVSACETPEMTQSTWGSTHRSKAKG